MANNTRWVDSVRNPRGRRRLFCFFGAVLVTLCVTAPSAHAADRIYWSNFDVGAISFANLDGSGGGDVITAGATMDGPMGMALDPSLGRVYWANWGAVGRQNMGTTISYANLDGGGGGTVPIAPGFVQGPHGLAIDPAAAKIYWPNSGNNTIGFANLDGSGAGVLNTANATVNEPRGVTVDPAGGRIYWANHSGDSISYANLNGSGGGNLNLGSATASTPEGVAIDPVSKRIFWAAYNAGSPPGHTVSYANLDGSGGADLDPSPIFPDDPHGVAIDSRTGKIWWPNYGSGTISSANLSGGGGTDLPTGNATHVGPDQPALLEAPSPSGAPSVKGIPSPGSQLSCSRGSWDPDAVSSLLYRAPSGYSYQWFDNGKALPDATESTLTIHSVGNFRCQVGASNAAGSTSQRSGFLAVFRVGGAKLNLTTGAARILVKVPDPGTLVLGAKGGAKPHAVGKTGSGAVTRKVKKAGRVRLKFTPKGKVRKRLNRSGKAKVKFSVYFKPDGGQTVVQQRQVTLKKR